MADAESYQPLIERPTLERLYGQEGSKDAMAAAVISRAVRDLVEFGVSPYDVRFHLTEATEGFTEEYINKEQS